MGFVCEEENHVEVGQCEGTTKGSCHGRTTASKFPGDVTKQIPMSHHPVVPGSRRWILESSKEIQSSQRRENLGLGSVVTLSMFPTQLIKYSTKKQDLIPALILPCHFWEQQPLSWISHSLWCSSNLGDLGAAGGK